MKTILLFIFLSSGIPAFFSQVWIRPNATWHYTSNFIGESGFVKVKYEGDTLIEGHTCQRLIGTSYKFLTINPQGDQFMSISSFSRDYTYASGDTVFYRKNDRFEVLYNFGLHTGDTWNVSTENHAGSLCNDTSRMRVIQTGQATLGGETLPFMDVRNEPNNGWGFTYVDDVNSRILSRIGNIGSGYLFPIQKYCDTNVVYDFTLFSFRCYEDDSISYNPYAADCEYFLGLETNEMQFSVSPNPVSDVLSVAIGSDHASYELISTTGQCITAGKLTPTLGTVDVSGLKTGIYYLKIQDEAGNTGIKKVLKQ